MNAKKIIKFAISLTMLLLVFRFANFEKLKNAFLQVPIHTIAIVTAGYLVGQIISAYKWWTIARFSGVDSTFYTALKAYFLGMYVNCFGFGIIGGDVARGILLADGKPRRASCLTSVVADRAHGLATLALIGTLSTALVSQEHLEPIFIYMLYGIAAAIVFGWFLGPKILLRLIPEGGKLRKVAVDIAGSFPNRPSQVLYITGISVVFHILQIALHGLMSLGVGTFIPIPLLFVTIPFVNMMASLPISWQGLGVRENSYLFFLFPHFLSREQALVFGAIWLFAVTFSSAVGGIIAFMTGDLKLVSETARSTATTV